MSDTINIKIGSTFDGKGVTDATKAVEGLARASGKGGNSGVTAAAAQQAQALAKLVTVSAQAAVAQDRVVISSEKVAQAHNKTAVSANQVTISESKMAQASNQAATAAQNLATAEQKTAAATAQAEAAQNRAALTALRLAQAQQRAADDGASYFQKFGSAVTGSLAGMVGPAAAATAAIATVQKTADLAVLGASLQGARQSFDKLAAGAGQSSAALLASMRTAAQGTVSDAQLIQSANTGILLTQGRMAKELPKLVEIARASAQAQGKEVSFVFDSLALGIARGSTEIIDNAGITLDAASAYAAYGAAIGKSADDLTKAEKQQAVLNAVLLAGKDIINQAGDAAGSNALKYQQAATAIENMKNKLAEIAAIGLAPVAEDITAIANAATGAGPAFDGIKGLNDLFNEMKTGLGPVADAIGNTFGSGIGLVSQYNGMVLDLVGSVTGLSSAQEANAGVTVATASATQVDAQASALSAAQKKVLRDDTADATAMLEANAQASAASAVQSQADSLAKQEHASKMELVVAQTQAAADAFLAANPQIDASGIAAATAAGKIPPLVGQLAAATLGYREAAAAAASFNAQAGIKAGVAAAGPRATAVRTAGDDLKNESIAARSSQQQAAALARVNTEQQKGLILARARGDKEAEIKILQDQQNYVAKDSIAYAQLEGQIITANAAKERDAAKGGAGGGRVSAAERAGERIAAVEQKTGNKLEDIDRATQNKLIEIDRKAAEERAKIAQQVNEQIVRDQADMRVNMEVNDFDALTATDDKQKEKIADRERAEMASMERLKQAQQEAQNLIAEGRADEAKATYEARKDQVSQLQDLDIKYAEVQRELADDPEKQQIAAQQYEEAKRAIEEQANTEIQIAAAAAETKAGVIQDEKDQVIAAASEQAGVVISRAQESAAAVKNASADAKNVAVANLKAIGDAVNAIPASKDIKVNVIGGSVAGTPATAGNRAAGGGSFVTSGPTTLTVGDNPGGAELVSVTPLSGKGTSRASGNLIALAGGGDVVVVGTGDGYTTPLPSAPAKGKKGKGGKGKPAEASAKDLKAQLDEQKNMVQLLKDMIELRGQLEAAVGQQPFDVKLVAGLVKRAREFTEMVRAQLVPLTKNQGEEFKRYTEAARSAISILSDTAQLRTDLQESAGQQPFDIGLIRGLAKRAKDFVEILRGQLVPMTEFEVDHVGRYADAVGSVTGVFKDVADLRKDLQGAMASPIDPAQIKQLALDANDVVRAIDQAAKAYSTKGLEAAKAFSDAAGSTFDAYLTGMKFFDALATGDFKLNRPALAGFQKDMLTAMDTTQVLAARAATIPEGNIARLESVSGVLSNLAETAIKLAAVPFTDISGGLGALSGQISAGIGAAFGGGAMAAGGTTINNTFVLPQGTTQQLAQEVIRILNTQSTSRR